MGRGSPFSGAMSPSGSDIEKCYSGSCPSPMRVCLCRSVSQPVLTQPLSLSATLGSSARLTCALSGGFRVGIYDIYWFQQQPGSCPRYLLRFYSDADKRMGSGVPSCFCGSKDASAKAGLLLISGLQAVDEADHYCATHGGGSSSFLTVSQITKKWELEPETLSLRLLY